MEKSYSITVIVSTIIIIIIVSNINTIVIRKPVGHGNCKIFNTIFFTIRTEGL